jgi:carboxyl-terminal processing protease
MRPLRSFTVSHRTRALFLFPVILIILVVSSPHPDWGPLLFEREEPPAPTEITQLPEINFSRQPAYIHPYPGTRNIPQAEAPSVAQAEETQAEEQADTAQGKDSLVVEARPALDAQVIAEQSKIFEELWGTVQEQYLYEDFNGLDWDAVHSEYTRRIDSGLQADEFYLAMDEMIARLGDDHSRYLNPEQVAGEQAKYAGKQDYAGIGIILAPVQEGRYASVVLTFPGGPADKAGIKARDSITLVDGAPILDSTGCLKDLIRGPEGTRVRLAVRSPGEGQREVSVIRHRINGPLPVPYSVMSTPGGQRVGYIFLVTFADSTIGEQMEQAIQEMNEEAPLDGLILDNRQNEGGASTVLTDTLGFFTGGLLGHFVSRREEVPFVVESRHISNSQHLPLVVLVGRHTFSYGEVFAGILQDIGRAFLIGETTQGNVETLTGFNLADGSRAWIAYKSFRPINDPEADWEASGVVPDLKIQANWYEHSFENDPLILSSLDYLDSQANLETQ